MKFFVFLIAILFGTANIEVKAEEQEWRQLIGCVSKHKENVARVVVSLQEGAELLFESLCLDESTPLLNKVANRDALRSDDNRFSNARYVIIREMKKILYHQKKAN